VTPAVRYRRWLPMAALCTLALAGIWVPEAAVHGVDLDRRLAAPSLAHPLGTDSVGRDVFARVAAGGVRALVAVALTLAFGLVAGVALAALWFASPRGLRAPLLRLCDLAVGVPSLLVALIVAGAVGLSPLSAALALAVGGAGSVAHLVIELGRGAARSLPVMAARALGGTPLHVFRRHLAPTLAPPILLVQGYEAGRVLLAWSALTFLGVGADTGQPDWGAMVFEYRMHLFDAPLLVLGPSAAILALALACACVADPRAPASTAGDPD